MVSINPNTFVEGGAVPVDKNLTWKECRFVTFDYTKKDGTIVATTTAAAILYVDDDGNESLQHYSVADPSRFIPSDDGKTLVPLGSAEVLNISSNFYILMNALLNAGFPENKMDEDISTLDGMITYNIGVPEPKRQGLKRETGDESREKILSIPQDIIKLPWDKKKKPAAGKAAKKESGGADAEDLMTAAAEVAKSMLAEDESITRKDLATKLVQDKQATAAQKVFTAEFEGALIANGMSLDGDDITLVE